ncbi:MAG: TusE/DsrC/DsvC family sulfur relay protein [Alphaproteobacteria bacterium]|jgi:TusE/DsrC/DsvC family sulfur relay protein|nr:TusE/DsrC/DsvC family sulfur relay protein [Alphaproteobacteria bacterium]MBT4084898.1 TusE/DsrC/DsvC family sulfur relay protein [Alphaproteobacteria bacterium]MBT4544089.1 TusE/DsrC/DsvC family sulfur relay protein [Alphaproteobacteria bacterium]MBT7747542.1 TusE/DsrC/DsvC family sulfur relay protein [Alphaproteobacteria bacterium]
MELIDLDLAENGHLVDPGAWTEEVAQTLAIADGIPELTARHMSVINYLRREFIENGGNQPNERSIIKAMSDEWGEKIKSKDIYSLFPKQPSKQAAMIAGLPETKRKGGY